MSQPLFITVDYADVIDQVMLSPQSEGGLELVEIVAEYEEMALSDSSIGVTERAGRRSVQAQPACLVRQQPLQETTWEEVQYMEDGHARRGIILYDGQGMDVRILPVWSDYWINKQTIIPGTTRQRSFLNPAAVAKSSIPRVSRFARLRRQLSYLFRAQSAPA